MDCEQQLKDCKQKLWYAKALISGLVIAVAVLVYLAFKECKEGFSFNDRSEYGYNYDVVERKFVSAKKDRPIALAALHKILERMGQKYTMAQLNVLQDSIIINILESDDDAISQGLIAKISLITNPRYKEALSIVEAGIKNSNRLSNKEERALVYDMLVSYFTALRKPLNIRLNMLSDLNLIQTFKTLTPPKQSEIGKSSNAGPVVVAKRVDPVFSLKNWF